MSDSLPPQRRTRLTLAQHGASAHEPPSSLEAFELALRLGASGVAGGVWLTRDGTPVVHHDGYLRRRLRRVPLRQLADDDLPGEVVHLSQLLAHLDVPFDLALDLESPDAVAPVLDAVRTCEDRTGTAMVDRLWLRHGDWEALAAVRGAHSHVHLVNSSRLAQMADGPERRAAQLGSAGIDAVQMPYADWKGGLVVLFARFEVLSFASQAEHTRMIEDLMAMDVDAISSTHADRLADARPPD